MNTVVAYCGKSLMQSEPQAAPLEISSQLDLDGYEILPGVLPPETVDNLLEEVEGVLSGRTGQSAHAMRHLVQTVPAIRQMAESVAIRQVVESVLGPQAFVARSLWFDKTPDANWKVAWHQDLTIAVREKIEVAGFAAWSIKDGVVHVQPPARVLEKMLTVRLHLDDCDTTNGPLQVLPGSHKDGRLDARQIANWRRQPPVVCVVPRGGALLMRPLLLHASSLALEPGHRRVIHLEFAADPLLGGLRWL